MKLLQTPGGRRFVCAAAGVATVVAVTACAGPANGSEDSVKIGLLANLTGGASTSFGIPFEQGFELALDEAKAQLDNAGVTVEVVTEDAKSAVPTAVTGYNKLRQEGVALVVQDSQSPLGQAVAPLASEDGIALLSGAGSSLENPDGYAFRFTDLATPTAAVGTYLSAQGAERIGVVVAGDNPSFATLAGATEKGLPTGFASRQEVSSQDSDFSAVLANLRRDRVDAVVLSVLPAQAGNLLLQASQSGGLDGVKLVGTLATSTETFTVAQDVARGFEFPQVWAPSISGDSDFQRRYTEQYGETPTAYGALGYQVGWIAAASIITADGAGTADGASTVDGAAVRDALPAASTSDLVHEHGILDLELASDGVAISKGVMATFGPDGSVVATEPQE